MHNVIKLLCVPYVLVKVKKVKQLKDKETVQRVYVHTVYVHYTDMIGGGGERE